MGLNLPATNTVICVDLCWKAAVHESRIGSGLEGQSQPVQVFVRGAEPPIEESPLSTVSAKRGCTQLLYQVRWTSSSKPNCKGSVSSPLK